MIAVDATVLADFLVGEPGFQRSAEKLMREDPNWITVGLWRYELGNVLWKMLTFDDASYVWLARSRGLKLRTRDKEVLKQCPDVAHSMPVV